MRVKHGRVNLGARSAVPMPQMESCNGQFGRGTHVPSCVGSAATSAVSLGEHDGALLVQTLGPTRSLCVSRLVCAQTNNEPREHCQRLCGKFWQVASPRLLRKGSQRQQLWPHLSSDYLRKLDRRNTTRWLSSVVLHVLTAVARAHCTALAWFARPSHE